MNYFRCLLILLPVILSSGCCKSERCKCQKEWGYSVDDCTPHHYGPYPLGGAKDYLYFKRGSWWVYRNSLSGERDSIYTISCDTFVVETKGLYYKWLSITYTTIQFEQRSDIYDVTYQYSRIKTFPDGTDFQYVQVPYRTAITAHSVIGEFSPFTYPFKDITSVKFIGLIPSLRINGVDYPEVAVFQTESTDWSVQIPTQLPYAVAQSGAPKYYWSKGYGLVQMESLLYKKSDSSMIWQRWELEKYHIEQ